MEKKKEKEKPFQDDFLQLSNDRRVLVALTDCSWGTGCRDSSLQRVMV